MSKNSDDKFSNDEFGVEGPAWADGKTINEAIFCEEFLSKHKILFSGGSFFTTEGRVVDEIPLKRMVFDDLKICAVSNVPQKISNIVELLKIQALDETFAPETDRIHLEDGTLYFNGCFVDIKESVVRTRLPVRYNPYAPKPERWLSFLDELLYPEDIPTLQEFIGYCLIPSNKGQRMMVIKGNGGEGKSQIGAVMTTLFGSNKIVKKETKPRQIYSIEEVQTILNLMADEPMKYFLFHILAFFCGYRRGELLGLEWKDFSFEERKIKIRRASLYSNDIGTYTSTPKTVGSRRTVVVSDDVIDLLKRYKAEQDEYKKMLGDAWIENDRLFTQWNGAPMGTSTPLNWYRKFCENNGIRYLCTHSCRHFNISLMIKNHIDVVSVSAAAGHKDVTTTLNIYAEEFEEANAASVETVSSCISIPSANKTTEE